MSLYRYQVPTFSNWSSFDRFSNLRNEVSRLFDFTPPSRVNNGFSSWTPAIDVFDNQDRFVVVAELPGLKKDEIALTLDDGVLTLSGERKNERTAEDGKTSRSERYFGKFERSVTLPAPVDGEKVTATYTDGILTVELIKAESAKPKTIPVTVS